MAVSDGWYEYHVLANGDPINDMINNQGWRLVPGQDKVWILRRSRLHF